MTSRAELYHRRQAIAMSNSDLRYSTLATYKGKKVVIIKYGDDLCDVRYVNTPMTAVFKVRTDELTAN